VSLTDGCEWVVDARGCSPALLGHLPTLRSLFEAVIGELQLMPVGEPVWHVFPAPGGITGLVPLAESHLTIHTFPEHRSACINLFCCRPRAEWPWPERLQHHLGAAEVCVSRLERRYADRLSVAERVLSQLDPDVTRLLTSS
jgi:S-adenosylmethionine decarboxylase